MHLFIVLQVRKFSGGVLTFPAVFGEKKKKQVCYQKMCSLFIIYIFMRRFSSQELWSLQLDVEEVCLMFCQMKMNWTKWRRSRIKTLGRMRIKDFL